MFLFFFGEKRKKNKNNIHKKKTAGEDWGEGYVTPAIGAKLTSNKSQLHFSLSINITLLNVNKVHVLYTDNKCCTEQRPNECSQGNQVLHELKLFYPAVLFSVILCSQCVTDLFSNIAFFCASVCVYKLLALLGY